MTGAVFVHINMPMVNQVETHVFWQKKYARIFMDKLAVYPDDPEEIRDCLENAGLVIVKQYETEFGFVFAAK